MPPRRVSAMKAIEFRQPPCQVGAPRRIGPGCGRAGPPIAPARHPTAPIAPEPSPGKTAVPARRDRPLPRGERPAARPATAPLWHGSPAHWPAPAKPDRSPGFGLRHRAGNWRRRRIGRAVPKHPRPSANGRTDRRGPQDSAASPPGHQDCGEYPHRRRAARPADPDGFAPHSRPTPAAAPPGSPSQPARGHPKQHDKCRQRRGRQGDDRHPGHAGSIMIGQSHENVCAAAARPAPAAAPVPRTTAKSDW